MDKLHLQEMKENLEQLIQDNQLQGKQIYLFGHCNATEELADLLLNRNLSVTAILDNNQAKHGKNYRGIFIISPQAILKEAPEQTIVCIVARAYAAMADQLKRLGYTGIVRKLVDYNSYAEYSLSSDTIIRKQERVKRGLMLLDEMGQQYPEHFKFLCPFSALGDIYFTMSYLPYFVQNRKIDKYIIAVIGNACAKVVKLFGDYPVMILLQKDMDEAIQASLYINAADVFIPHQDRPYVVNLSKVLYIKCISLEKIYCCGVFGLPALTKPVKPVKLRLFQGKDLIKPGKTVIFSPYAKSVTALKKEIWIMIVGECQKQGWLCYTNVVQDEVALPGTLPISPDILEIQSLVELAGMFIGIRSGLCDVIREAACRKIALYPDYYYCDTKWKAIDMYSIEGWENIVVGEDFSWKIN